MQSVRDIESEPPLVRASVRPARRVLGGWERGVVAGGSARVLLLVLAPAVLIGVLAWPMLFTSAGFNEDWPHHAWYIWNQSLAIREGHLPGFFLNYSHAVLYPEFAFYGGTLYAIAGTVSVLLGNAPIATTVLGYFVGFAAAYGGWYWISRSAGLSRWWSQIPALIFITSGYYITLIYGRGDLQEFLGVSMIPLLVAAGIAVLRAERLRLGPALALAGSGVLYFGSHNLTIVWGSTFLAILCLAVLAAIPQTRGWLSWRGVLRVAAILVPTLLVSAWFLLPAAAYQSSTVISTSMAHWEQLMEQTMGLVAAGNIFALGRPSAAPGAGFVLALPVLAIAWASVCVVLHGRGGLRSPWIRLLLICAILASLVTVLMVHAPVVFSLPHPYAMLQFAYRLESYVILAVTGAVLAGLVLAQRATDRLRAWRWAAVAVALVSVVGAIQQTSAYPHGPDRYASVESRVPSGAGPPLLEDYLDVYVPTAPPTRRLPQLEFPLSAVHGDSVSAVAHFAPHELVATNIADDPKLVRVTGAKVVGRSWDGNLIVEVEPPRRGSRAGAESTPTEVISASGADGWPVVVGRVLSLAAALFLVVLLTGLASRSLRRRRSAPAALDC